jgi:hypothetical protein
MIQSAGLLESAGKNRLIVIPPGSGCLRFDIALDPDPKSVVVLGPGRMTPTLRASKP